MPQIKGGEDRRAGSPVARIFEALGIAAAPEGDGGQLAAVCPFCRKRKWRAAADSGKWDCKACGRAGNPLVLLRQLWETGRPDPAIGRIAADRRIKPDVLEAWGWRLLPSDGRTAVLPMYCERGILWNLARAHRSAKPGGGSAWKLLPVPGIHPAGRALGFFRRAGRPPDAAGAPLAVCEGPWDGMALDAEAGSGSSIIAVPGAGAFSAAWASLGAGRAVSLLYDNDWPRDGSPGPGFAGMRRAAGILLAARPGPASVRWLAWGPEKDGGADRGLPDGYDVRDWLGDGKPLGELLAKLTEVPRKWARPASGHPATTGGGPPKPSANGKHRPGGKHPPDDVEPGPDGEPPKRWDECRSWDSLVNLWRRAMKWSEGLDRALSAILAVAVTTRMPDEQLWVLLVSPPSTGKTSLCEGLATNEEWVKEVGTFTGLHSGWQTDPDAEEDHSMLARIKDKTFVVKEGDMILKSPNREHLLAQLRDAYDTHCSVAYKNKVKRDYRNHRFSHILCGTEAMFELDSADLGSRYLTVVIMEGVDPGLETEINHRTFHRVLGVRGLDAGGADDPGGSPAMAAAKRATGGYVEHLRTNAADLLGAVADDNAEELAPQFDDLSRLVAYMRARPAKRQDEAASREMSARINAQLTKLALGLAAAMGRGRIDGEIMRRVRRTAMDTARGRTMAICAHLFRAGENGLAAHALGILAGEPDEKLRPLLRFLRRIGAAECVQRKGGPGIRPAAAWRLAPDIAALWGRLFPPETAPEGRGRR